MTKPTNGAHNAAAHKICEERTPTVARKALVRFPTAAAPQRTRMQAHQLRFLAPFGCDLLARRGRLYVILKFLRLGDRFTINGLLFSGSGAGNKSSGGTLSLRHGLAGSGLRLVSAVNPVSSRFGDQLIAVLPRLRRFARGLSGSVADADDLVQAACERALARQHQFQEGTRFDSWMFRIVQTIWIDQVRSREVRKEDGDVPEERLGSDEPVRRVEARLALDEVRRAVSRLPDRKSVV